ncbi:MAG: transglutaminase domain-containing protein [Bacteroidales bacterium]|nr:transglutaminase domain-containing protein [Bacteroidales bacterium]
MRHKIFLLAMPLMLLACHRETHFITDAGYRAQVEMDFEARKLLASGRATELFSVMDSSLSLEEREAMQFLYAYMPYSDLADYDGNFFLKQVRCAFAARDTFSWGRTVPEEIFRHFVLVYRVNNENLDTARMYIFNELKGRLKGMTMYDAALEVNHWCHEHVTYRPSDVRTSAPLATLRTGFGRCGEESTLAVTALRAVGIPARQCYTPRWAHCDDNHAWVEVWVEGQWRYLGACEPAAKLDMAWFSQPATRCMMVHTKAFGRYNGDEEVVRRTGLYSELNLLSHYADTRHITATVQDREGKPVREAQVKFKLYNYSEYYTLATMTTDADGQASITTGLGDLLVWACKDGKYGYVKIDVRKNDRITLKLTRSAGEEYVENLEINPPVGKFRDEGATEAEIAANACRLACEDSMRNAYLATFPTISTVGVETHGRASLQPNPNLTDEQIQEIIRKCEGNYAEIIKFINNHADEKLAGEESVAFDLYPDVCHETWEKWNVLYDYLCSFSDKDLRDITADVLEAHCVIPSMNFVGWDYEIYKKGLLPARISNEMVRPYRKELAVFNGYTADSILRWTAENIIVDDTGNYYRCPISPVGVYKLRHADAHSRDIFFIAACRAAGIPAYMDNATEQLFVYDVNKMNWQIVSFAEKQEQAKTGKLRLEYHGAAKLKPQYWSHFTIAKFENGDFVTFDYENDPRVASFPATLELEAGYYMLSTGNRYSDGAALSRLEFFNVSEGETVTKELVIRPLEARPGMVYGCVTPDMRVSINSEQHSLPELLGKNPLVLCYIEPDREPTKHLLNELSAMQKTFDEWKIPFLMVVPEGEERAFDPKRWHLPHDTKVAVDSNGLLLERLAAEKICFKTVSRPLVLIVRSDGKVTFKSEGYRIGTAELVFKSL